MVIFAHLIQSASSLPTDASALESAISALERDINALESSSVPLEHWLPWFNFLVVFGVLVELWVIAREYLDERSVWARGTIRSPEKPSIAKYLVEVLSVLLITGGIVGELWIGVKITSINGVLRSKNAELRSKSDQLLALVTQQAGDAATSSRTAHNEADAVKRETDALTTRLMGATNKLGELEHQFLVQGPRWRLLEDNKSTFIAAAKPFAGQRFTVVRCGQSSGIEPSRLEQDLLNFLGKNGAGWAMESPGYATWKECNGLLGNWITFSSTANDQVKDSAKALGVVLNKMQINTSPTPALPWQEPLFLQVQGADSPWELAVRDPTAVFILVGYNPTFDLYGLSVAANKRHK